MKYPLKSTVSILALALALSAQTTFAMDDSEDHAGIGASSRATVSSSSSVSSSSRTSSSSRRSSHSFTEEVIPGPRPLTVIKDAYENSASQTYSKQAKTDAAGVTDAPEKVRILSSAGGGVRGLFTAIEFAVLEEIMNDSLNASIQSTTREKIKQANFDDYNKRRTQFGDNFPLYIRDIFDVGAGTSTGSILTAGLFGYRHFSAIDLAKIYARYGYKIFDDHKQNVSGLTRAFYAREGLDTVLHDHFKNNSLQEVYKPIYIIAANETGKTALVFSTNPQSDDAHELHRIYLRTAVACSSSAPVFFDPVQLETSQGKIKVSDGGTVANNPSMLVYAIEKAIPKTTPAAYEIYSFGTGDVPPSAARVNAGAIDLLTLFTDSLTQQENLALTHGCLEAKASGSQLDYFAHINPRLEKGMGKLEDTSPFYTQYMIKKALSVTKGQAFASMMKHLGFQMPDSLNQAHENVKQKLNSLKSNKYSELDNYEKEFVIKKILDLDFMFYQNRYHQDPKTGKVLKMTEEEAQSFLHEVGKDIAQRKEKNDDWLNYMWGFVTTDSHANILEFIPRCMDFHGLSRHLTPLSVEDFASLTTKTHFELSAEEKKYLDKPIEENKIKHVQNRPNKLVCDLFTKFVEFCDSDKAKYKYPKLDYNFMGFRKQPYLDVVGLIFWKDALKMLEGSMTKTQLIQLKENLLKNADEAILYRSYTPLGSYVRTSRYKLLVQELDTYIKKFFPDEPVLAGENTETTTTTVNTTTTTTTHNKG